ncbi:type IV pilus modification protein PilV [Halomonas sp. BM-2019]|uniref:type IV pilus modification protein PilV n=1 Tax=Halomonas sp. BM-2019 TaxID=2811227 RepID=UPI001B3C49C0|nr:MAG: type IV pilus modification protein PilV [Halomonas sp. BM-2019]
MVNYHSVRQKGFTLIEALVALLVLSIGLLGVAAMQLNALQGAHAAYQRSIASLAAQDAQERLWAELAAKDALECLNSGEVSSVLSGWIGSGWSEFLPGFTQSSISPASGCEFSINVRWEDRRFGGDFENFSYMVRLPGE